MRLTRISRSPFVFWGAVAALALVTALVVARLVGRAGELAARYGPLRAVVVATRAVDRGSELAAADVSVGRLPARFLPAGALSSVSAVQGRTALVPLVAGQLVLAGQLGPEGRTGIAALLPAGARAVAVPTGGSSVPLRRGDAVDLLATFDPHAAGGGEATVEVATAALVLDVGPEAATVAVAPDEARAVAFALTNGALIVVLAPGPGPAAQRTPVASSASTAAPTSTR